MALGLLIAFLVLCFYQDVRYRGIHWVLFPLAAASSVWFNLSELNLLTIGTNVLILSVMMGLLTVYVSLKSGKLTNITQSHFAWGDILFLLAIAPLFSIQVFIAFISFGTLITLIIHLVSTSIKPQETVPYAGYMALVAIAYAGFKPDIDFFLATI